MEPPPPKRQCENQWAKESLAGVGDEEWEEDPGLLIVYKHAEVIHRALGLPGSPVPQAQTPPHSSDSFQSYVYGQLVSGVPDKLVNCVEDAQSTIGTSVEYFPYRLSERTFLNLLLRLKQLFASTDPWVQALPAPLGTVFEVRGGTVQVIPQVILHGPFKYP